LPRYGGPSWDDVKHARLWVDGMTGPTNLQIGGIELVGSAGWRKALPDSLKSRVVFDVKVRNNKDDVGYTAPFGRAERGRRERTRREHRSP